MISVGATYWGIRAQRSDALLINLAGRQRMLTQKMTWLALAQPNSPDLIDTIELFEATHQVLQEGGTVFYPLVEEASAGTESQAARLPPPPDPAVQAQLDEVAGRWMTFRSTLQPVDAVALQRESPRILAAIDEVVKMYEGRAQAKLARVQIIQAATLIAGLSLVSIGYLFSRKRIVLPLAALSRSARRMAQGDLNERVPNLGDDELGELGMAFEAMRVEVAAAHEDLEMRVSKRTGELETAFEFSQEIVAELEPEHLLQSVCDHARNLTKANAAALCLLDPHKANSLFLVATSGQNLEQVYLRQSFDVDPANRVINAGETVIVQADCTDCSFLQAQSPAVCAVAPLRSGDKIQGALCVALPPKKNMELEETRALTLLANAATVAIQNAELVEVQRQQAELGAAQSERDRLAAELHDNLAQTLGFMNLKVDQIRSLSEAGKIEQSSIELAQVKAAINNAYDQVRAALVGLDQPARASDDYARQLTQAVEVFRQISNLPIQLDIAGLGITGLSSLTSSQSLHILREALTNASRHAQAQNISVSAFSDQSQARIIIEDDGIGFDPQSVGGGNHMGLRLMRARAERSGGTLTVESKPGEGTRLELCYPLDRV